MTVETEQAERVDPHLLTKAMTALMGYHKKTSQEKKALLGSESAVQVNFGLERVPEKASNKPIRIGIPHSLWRTNNGNDEDGMQEPDVCLIVKEDSKEWVQAMISQFPEQMSFVKKVLGLDSLRKKHSRYEQQRALLARFDVFMADDRILPMLAKAIGRNFFRTKKQPIPIKLARKSALPYVIIQSLRSTFLFIPEGTTVTVRAGNTSMSPERLAANVQAIVREVPEKLPRKWANVRSIEIKTPDSVALPIYNKTPEELKEIARLAGVSSEISGTEPKKQTKGKKNDQKVKKTQQQTQKSPLLEALRKQKANEEKESNPNKKKRKQPESEVGSDKGATTTNGNKSKKKICNPESSGKKGAASKSDAATTAVDKAKKKKKGNDKSKEKVEAKESEASPKQRNNEESSNKKGTGPKSETAKVSISKAKKRRTSDGSAEKIESFIRAKKYAGSKDGYVFRAGMDGLGYYLDKKPVVDKMVIDAFRRMGASPERNRRTSAKKKGKRHRMR